MDNKSTNLQLPSNFSFGMFFSFIFILLSLFLYWNSFAKLSLVAFLFAIFFIICTFIAPQLLNPLNELWYKFGIFLGKFINPIVLGFIFYLIITPIALITRIFGRDELKIKKRNLATYWINRSPHGPDPHSFKNQY
jgi:hypothetical protein